VGINPNDFKESPEIKELAGKMADSAVGFYIVPVHLMHP
jgi:hypothetical protein